uniref:IS3 family transposase n=1 Tax=Mesorhizobium silamurunense TaxID=499528 RepID=UPI0017812C7E
MAGRQRVIDEDQKLELLQRMKAGETVSKLADEVGISRQRLYEWRDQLRLRGNLKSRRRGRPARVAGGVDGDLQLQSAVDPPTPQEKALTKARRRIRDLEQKVGQQQLDLDFFREALRHFEEDQRRSSAPDSAPRRAETGLRDLIQKMALGNAHYGYRRIGALLRREGWQVNHKCILRIMREDNLLCLRARPFVPATTNSRHGWQVVPNLARGMILSGVNQLWVADITFLHLAEEFAFLAVVLDAFSRRVVGWALDTHLRASLAIEALEMAITDRQPTPGSLVHHSDRGVQGGFKRSSQHQLCSLTTA